MELITMGSLPDEVLFRIAIRFQNELVLKCPVLTGRLRSSIVVKVKGNTLIVTMAEYGIHVEFGTNRQRPNPFVRNAIHTKLNNIIQEEIEKYYS